MSFGALVVSLLLGSALAEDKDQDNRQKTFRTRSSLVLAPALVKNQNGGVIYGLQAKDFIIEDDGVEQTVHMDENDEAGPISMVVAIQRGRTAADELIRMRGLGAMLEPLFSQGRTQAALVVFDSQVELVRDFTFDGGVISSDLKQLRSGDNGAVIIEAVNYSVGLLKNTPEGGRRIVLLISETRDHGSRAATMDQAIAGFGESNTLIYALAFSPTVSNVLDTMRGNKQDQMEAPNLGAAAMKLLVLARQAMRENVPKTIAGMTGGEYELFKSRYGFDDLLNSFANHLGSRYQLSFEPKQPHPGLHELRVRLREPGKATVLARTSYWVEPPDSAPQ